MVKNWWTLVGNRLGGKGFSPRPLGEDTDSLLVEMVPIDQHGLPFDGDRRQRNEAHPGDGGHRLSRGTGHGTNVPA